MKWVFVGLLAALIAAIAFFPLRLAVERLAPGLEADSIEGSIWNGELRNARWEDVPLGDLDVGLEFTSLFRGDANLNFSRLRPGPLEQQSGSRQAKLTGQVGGNRQIKRIEDLNGELRLALLPAPIPEIGLQFSDISVGFGTTRGCVAAGGIVTATVKGLPLIGDSPPLSGTPRCDGEALFVPLAATSGQIGLDLWLWQDGRYRAGLRVSAPSTLVQMALIGAGFTPVDGGVSLLVEGRAGQRPVLAKG